MEKTIGIVGLNDEEVTSFDADSLKRAPYVLGLAKFISECKTPMTIAIQGDWGSGKTSFMKMLNEKLDDESVKKVWFNTWQYSQFELGKDLPINFIREINSCLRKGQDSNINENNQQEYRKEQAWGAVRRIKDILARPVIEATTGLGNAADAFDALLDILSGTDKKASIAALKVLKENFSKYVDNALSEEKNSQGISKERLVIFVDDLDRLEPEIALSLLEVLKIILECDKCVFVLAIDASVIYMGLKSKYGDQMSDEKCRNFFDKIIQVPFRLPAAQQSDIESYLAECFRIGGGQQEDKIDSATLKEFAKLINYSVGYNPRSIKRLLNSYFLISNIVEARSAKGSKGLLFAMLCLQSKYEVIHQYMVSNGVSPELLMRFKESDDLYEEIGMQAEEIAGAKAFMTILYGLVDKNNDGSIESKEFAVFAQILEDTKITSSNEGAAQTESKQSVRRKYVYKGEEFKSHGKNSIGMLGYSILRDLFIEQSWNMQNVIAFREYLIKNIKSSWLHEMVYLQSEVKTLPSNPKYNEGYKKGDDGVYRLCSLEQFVDSFFSYMKRDDKNFEAVTYDEYVDDQYAITLADGTKAFIARFWGASDIEKLRRIIKEYCNIEVDVAEITEE